MVQTVSGPATASNVSSARDACLKAYRFMLLARVLDEKFASLYRAGKIHGGVFLGRGQEALSAAVGMALRKGDVFAPLIRDQAGRLAFGEPPIEAVRSYLGSVLGAMRGRDGNIHRGRPQQGYLPMISHLGAMISVVNGILFAKRLKGGEGAVGAACVGEGATSTGSFHEGLNQAAVEKLPLVLVVANNQYAYSTPNSRQFACQSLADKAAGYGVEVQTVEALDLPACLGVVNEAVRRARTGQGPQLIVANLLRLCGHGEHDDASYVSPEIKASAIGRDCLKVTEELFLSKGWSTADELSRWREEAVRQVDDTVTAVQREPAPDPYTEDWSAISSRHLAETHEETGIAGLEI